MGSTLHWVRPLRKYAIIDIYYPLKYKFSIVRAWKYTRFSYGPRPKTFFFSNGYRSGSFNVAKCRFANIFIVLIKYGIFETFWLRSISMAFNRRKRGSQSGQRRWLASSSRRQTRPIFIIDWTGISISFICCVCMFNNDCWQQQQKLITPASMSMAIKLYNGWLQCIILIVNTFTGRPPAEMMENDAKGKKKSFWAHQQVTSTFRANCVFFFFLLFAIVLRVYKGVIKTVVYEKFVNMFWCCNLFLYFGVCMCVFHSSFLCFYRALVPITLATFFCTV